MENAVEGLKLAFAVLLLTMALSLTIAFFSKARTTAEAVLQSSDKTAYYDYSKYSVPQDTPALGRDGFRSERRSHLVPARRKSGTA